MPVDEKILDNSKRHSFLISLLSILLLSSCIIAGFFAWKTQELVKTIRGLKSNPIPMATSSPVADQTANWREYINKDNNYTFKFPESFKYPSVITAEDSNFFSMNENVNSPLALTKDDALLETSVYVNTDKTTLDKVELINKADINDILDQPFQPIGKLKKISTFLETGSILIDETSLMTGPEYYIAIIKNENKIYTIKLFAYQDKLRDLEKTFDQIVTTFKFIENKPASSSLPVACTMDAKICPDGSAVGRSGPNCEFDPCPTIKPASSTSPQP